MLAVLRPERKVEYGLLAVLWPESTMCQLFCGLKVRFVLAVLRPESTLC